LDDQTKQSRKEIEKESRKTDIINTAAQLFSEKGFHDVKMDDIAERVGLSKGTIYLYFENKETLFFSIIQVRLSELTKQIQEILLLDEPFVENLRRFVTTCLGFLERHQAFFKIMHSEKMRMNVEEHYKMHDCAIEAYQTIFGITGELIRRGQKECILREDTPETLSKILLGILDAYLYQRVFLGSKVSIEEEVDQVIDYYLNGAKASH
jgi:AcrR family transcriptional regulator